MPMKHNYRSDLAHGPNLQPWNRGSESLTFRYWETTTQANMVICDQK